MTENVTGVFGFNGRSLTAPGTRVVSANGEDTIRIIGSAAEWHALMDQMNRYYHPHPPVDDVPEASTPDMIRIDDILDVREGDLVHVKGATETFECVCVNRHDIHSTVLRLQVRIDAPWIGSVGTYVWLRDDWFDYAERPKQTPAPTPSLPTFPDEDRSFHFFIGADGTKVLYIRGMMLDDRPWRVEGGIWRSPTDFAQLYPKLLPLKELDAPDESGRV